MRLSVILVSVPILLLSFLSVAEARNVSPSTTGLRFVESPQPPSNPPEIGGSMFQAAAATTVQLGWWQFDTPGGQPTTQGWTTHDLTTQIATYFHVDGTGGAPCHAITPVNESKSMWCGQWATTEYPWCGWATLPGYGVNWDQMLVSTVTGSSITYTIEWDSEPGYDFTYLEWWDPVNNEWVADVYANGGTGGFDGAGGPLTESLTSPYGATKARFHVLSDGAWCDQDGLWDTAQGAALVDDIVFGGSTENWEGEACGALQSTDGKWVAAIPPGFGIYAHLVSGATILQEDPCVRVLSNVWAFFDDPAVTNYACGGWPLQGAMPYGPDENGHYMLNEIWSPFFPITGSGDEYILSFLTYRDLPLDNLQFYIWGIKSRAFGGCAWDWEDLMFVYYGGQKDWIRTGFQIGTFLTSTAEEMMVRLAAYDYCGVWCGLYGTGSCHSHAPIFDQVRVVRVATSGPQFTWRDIDMWQDNFPELGGIGAADYARCDMAQSILPSSKTGILPGDSLKIVVTDPKGLASDNIGGLPGKAVYVFVKVTDRSGNPVAGKNGLAIQSPDFKRYPVDVNVNLRWPLVPGLAPVGWDAYRLDQSRTGGGSAVKDTYCADLMDLAAGPDGPPYHALTENVAANTGIFAPGDVIRYFFGAKNANNQWAYYHRTFNGQGAGRRTDAISEAMASPMEWSVLPDKGREPGDGGDMLFVDDADDRGGPAQLYFDMAFRYMGLTDKVDRFDVLGPSSVVGNSLAGRVKNIQAQIIGDPTEMYQVILWNSSDLSRGIMGDGGTPNGGSSAEKSDDYALAYTFLNTHPGDPGWAMWCDDAVQDWNTLVGLSAVNVKSIFMNHTLAAGDQRTVSGIMSPQVVPPSPIPPAGYLQPSESFYAHGGCAVINDFDVPGQSGLSRVSHRYVSNTTGQTAALSQITPNGAASNARFFLAGFAYNFIRDDDTNGVPDYVNHLHEILTFFQSALLTPTGIDPVAFANNLDNAYPNPFNPATTIRYSIASAGRVSLRVYNAAGQLVRTLVDEEQTPRAEGFSVTWDGTGNKGGTVASGVYFYRLTATDFSQTKKMVLLK